MAKYRIITKKMKLEDKIYQKKMKKITKKIPYPKNKIN